ncbi:MAG: DUF2934 domain-containing protein [Polyangiales bacterium]
MRRKVAQSVSVRISAIMESNNIKAASRSQSKRSKNRKAASSTATAGSTSKRADAKTVRRTKSTKTAAKRAPARQGAALSAQQRAQRIAEAAYFLAEQRAFAPNHELDDWLSAERSL